MKIYQKILAVLNKINLANNLKFYCNKIIKCGMT